MSGHPGDTIHVYKGPLEVDYRTAYVLSGDADDTGDVPGAYAGQTNRLLGAALPGMLYLTTGRSSGDIEIEVELSSSPRGA